MGTALVLAAMLAGAAAEAQDTRTVTEPLFPASCTVLSSQMAIVANGPASETAPDTARIQSALTACATGKAVELAGSGSNFAFLTGPLNIPSGVSLIVDGGVTLFASRNREDFQSAPVSSSVDECGTQGKGNGCKTLFSFNNGGTNSGSGIYGYGVIDGRGYATTLKGGVDTGISWWQNADNLNGLSQSNPILMKFSKSTNFTLYKITLRNSPMFHVGWAGTGFTAWGIKIQAPFTAHNTDGIDPDGTNVTITNSSISDGDDDVAIGASSPSANVTISNVTTYSGHGISVGSYTQGGLQNMLVTNVNMAGTAADGNTNGIRLKSAADRGGLLNNLTYRNMCIKDAKHILEFNPFYNTNSGSLLPQFSNVTLQNIHFLAPTVSTLNYQVQLQGRDAAHQTTMTLDNVVFDSLLASNVTPAPQYTSIALGPGPVYPAFLQSLTGTGVAYTGSASATSGGAYDCSAPTTFPYVVGELYVSTASATNLQTATVTSGAPFTLNAMVQPAMSQQTFNGQVGSYTGAPALSKPITLLEGKTVVGTAALGANGSLAPLTLTGASVGTHTYTAVYPGDATYTTPINFGSVTVTVSGSTAAATTTSLAVSASTLVYGTATTLTATISSSAAGTPTGSVTFLNGNTTLATIALSGSSAVTTQVLGGGVNSLTAVYVGDVNFQGSSSSATSVNVSPASSTVTAIAAPATLAVGASTTFSIGLTRAGSGSNPTGTVRIVEGASSVASGPVNAAGNASITVSPATAGSHSYTASYSGDANYSPATSSAVNVTVGGVTATSLSLLPPTIFAGGVETLSAAVSSPAGTVTGTVTFSNATGVLGTATLNGAGVAILNVTENTLGTQVITAVYAGSFAASSSGAQTLTVVPAITASTNPNSISLAAGASGTVALQLAPGGGFTGVATLVCTSPVAYITCSVAPASENLSGASPVASNVTIAVAPTVGALLHGPLDERRSSAAIALALLFPLGLAGLVRRSKPWREGLLMAILSALLLGIPGCGSGSTGSSAKLPPAGTQMVTVTATSGSYSASTSVTVVVTN